MLSPFNIKVFLPILSGYMGIAPEPSDDDIDTALLELKETALLLSSTRDVFAFRATATELILDPQDALNAARTVMTSLPDELTELVRIETHRDLFALIVDLSVTVEETEVRRLATSASLDASDDALVSRLAHELAPAWVEEVICCALLASLLSWPGHLQFLSGTCVTPTYTTVLEHTEMRLEYTAIGRTIKIGWPPFSTLRTPDALKWIQALPGYESSFGKGRLGRALAAFSYIASPKHQIESDILWPLIGLEALFCDGKENLQSQIIDKSESFLGPCTSHKKSFKRIYQARSSFVHGGLDMPMAYTNMDGTSEYDSFFTELMEARELATALLVATLKKCAADGRLELEFRYELKT